jgi:hypothetical protein
MDALKNITFSDVTEWIYEWGAQRGLGSVDVWYYTVLAGAFLVALVVLTLYCIKHFVLTVGALLQLLYKLCLGEVARTCANAFLLLAACLALLAFTATFVFVWHNVHAGKFDSPVESARQVYGVLRALW